MTECLSRAEAYYNLSEIIKLMREQKIEAKLIESVEIAQKSLLAIEIMGLISYTEEEVNTK